MENLEKIQDDPTAFRNANPNIDLQIEVGNTLSQLDNFLTFLEFKRMKFKKEDIQIEPEFISKIIAFMDYVEKSLNLSPSIINPIRELTKSELQHYITIFERLKRFKIEIKKILFKSSIIR